MSASRPAQDQVPPTTPPPQTAEQARYRRRGHRSAPPPPPSTKFGPGRGRLGVYIWMDIGPRRHLVSQERSAGAGGLRRVWEGPASSLGLQKRPEGHRDARAWGGAGVSV